MGKTDVLEMHTWVQACFFGQCLQVLLESAKSWALGGSGEVSSHMALRKSSGVVIQESWNGKLYIYIYI